MSACQWLMAIFTNTPKDGPKVPHSEMCSNKDLGLRPRKRIQGSLSPLDMQPPESWEPTKQNPPPPGAMSCRKAKTL